MALMWGLLVPHSSRAKPQEHVNAYRKVALLPAQLGRNRVKRQGASHERVHPSDPPDLPRIADRERIHRKEALGKRTVCEQTVPVQPFNRPKR